MTGRFPGVPVVVHSAGDPALGTDEVDAMCGLARWPNVLIMLSGKTGAGDRAGAGGAGRAGADGDAGRAFLERLTRAYGPGRLMWGSYALFAGARLPRQGQSLGDVIAGVRGRLGFLEPSELAQVLGGTAQRVFWPEGHGRDSGRQGAVDDRAADDCAADD
jgi:predicted TIM-barrel fold metal-dependent hydrolase